MERREHHRAQLRLPVRLRWTTPFGQKIEVCETLDVSRGGLRVPSHEAHAAGVPLWVTFPYNVSFGDGQPEVLAKVVRSCAGSNGERCTEVRKNSLGVAVKEKSEVQPPSLALHFEIGAHGQ